VAKAIWNGKVIAESDHTVRIEGHLYFPIKTVNPEYLEPSDRHTTCFWKGVASYYDIRVEDKINRHAAWHYPDPSQRAEIIRNHIAFWHGVEIIEKGEA
jgi:uncharacterized protein (DUF427 family)